MSGELFVMNVAKQESRFFKPKNAWITLLLLAVMVVIYVLPLPARAASLADLFSNNSTSQADFLAVEQAFQLIPTQQDKQLTVHVVVTPGYYVYKQKFKLELPEGWQADELMFNQSPVYVDDPEFGKVAVFKQDVSFTTKLMQTTQVQRGGNNQAQLHWQGCASAGLCYPPETHRFILKPLPTGTTDNSTLTPEVTTLPKAGQNVAENKLKTKVVNVDNTSSQQITNQQPTSQKTASQDNQPKPAKPVQINPLNAQSSLQTIPLPPLANTATHVTTEATAETAFVATSDNASDNNKLNAANSQYNATTADSTPARDAIDKKVIDLDPFGLATHPWLAFALLFLAGLGLAFTPCVLPMLPIVANIVAHQHKHSAKQGLMLTGSYGLGVASSYAMLGVLVAIFGQQINLIGWLQRPSILLAFATIFVLLGLYMLELLPIRLPHKLVAKVQKLGQVGENRLGSLLGSFMVGFFSALVVSPCISAPLAGVLLSVATVGNPFLGAAALFMLGLGLSTPLIALGATEGKFLPESGMWMNWVKRGFALLLFAVALFLVERIFISPVMLVVWAAMFMVFAVWLFDWQGRGKKLLRALAFMLAVWAAVQLVGAAFGSTNPWQPLSVLTQHNQASRYTTVDTAITPPPTLTTAAVKPAITIQTLEQLQPLLAQQDRVLVDVFADWCIECRIMEKNLLANPPAQLQYWQVVRLDITETNAASKAVLQAFHLFGPPALLYFDQGKLVERQVGEVKRAEFIKTLQALE